MSIVVGSLFLVMLVFVIPGTAIIGSVYMQYLMETRPPRGKRLRHTEASALPARAGLFAERA